MPFHNPYHFVPVNDVESPDAMAVEAFDQGDLHHVTHDRYLSGQPAHESPIYSGRLLCRLTTEGPVVIGDQRDTCDDESHRITPFELDGRPAIPASTLRGLTSSVAEAASNSALRVLEDRPLSYRVEMKDSLQALGLIVAWTGSDGRSELRLRPMALPPLSWDARSHRASIPVEYRTMFQAPLLKVYIDGYQRNQRAKSPEVELRPHTFLHRVNPPSHSADHPAFWYLKLSGTCDLQGVEVTTTAPHISRGQLLGQKAVAGAEPISQAEYDRLPLDQKPHYTRGILRVLGIEDRTTDIPGSKTHEIFIPCPPGMGSAPAYPVEAAIQRFESLAAERTSTKETLPFHVKGSKRNLKPGEKQVVLRPGDLVFFRPDKDHPNQVAEVSISSIWRRRAGGSTHDYFRSISNESLPFNSGRNRVSLAEQLFGFVEQSDKDSSDEASRSLASRLRFSFGHLGSEQDSPLEPEVLLKILDSPKPPSPALYFKWHRDRDTHIDKKKLDPKWHAPQGRKFYLHRRRITEEDWKTLAPKKNLPQKSRVRPLRADLDFYFHIDFENLSRVELGLLCYAIRPTAAFRHKLGMGKPLGLGQVRIDPVGLFYINRRQRYLETSLLDTPRYQGCWIETDGRLDQWPNRYRVEQRMAQQTPPGEFPDFDLLRQFYKSIMENKYADILRSLELLGEPEHVGRPVRYPQIAGVQGEEIEAETYRWFVANDVGSGRGDDKIEAQHIQLDPLHAESPRLPTLPEHPWNG